MLKHSPKVLPLFTFTLMVASFVPLHVSAQAAAERTPSTSMPGEVMQAPEAKFIQDLGDSAIQIIADKSLDQTQRTAKYHKLLQVAFDIKTIGHFAIGRAWDTATPEQQQEYLKLFETLVVKIYGDRLNFYSGERFVVKGVRQESDQDTIVTSEVQHPGDGQSTTIDWRLRRNGNQLAIIDVIIAGVSQSVTERQEYASILQRNGGKIDGLLDVMRQRAQGVSSP